MQIYRYRHRSLRHPQPGCDNRHRYIRLCSYTKIIDTGIYIRTGRYVKTIDADIHRYADKSAHTDIYRCTDNYETFQATVNNKWIARTFDKAAYPTRSQSSEQ